MDTQAPIIPSTHIFSAKPAQVGDGFFIQRAIPLAGRGLASMEPFLMLDHAGPTTFGPTDTPRGVDVHPHKGFQTVTLAYQGDLVHKDSAGNRGHLQPGDVQWMTAGSGIVHEEKHGPELTKHGGVSEMIQLWINLPARNKSVLPHYTDYRAEVFPIITLSTTESNFVRLIAGNWGGYHGPAKTYTPLTLADLYLDPGCRTTITIDPTWNTGVYVLEGEATINSNSVGKHHIAHTHDESSISIEATAKCHLLFMSGLPIGEPIASYGPFVMNTEAELEEAMRDYRGGKFGTL